MPDNVLSPDAGSEAQGRLSASEFDEMFGDLAESVAEEQAAEGDTEAGVDAPRKRIMATPSTKMGVLRNFPSVISQIARAEFPDATTNTDAVVAYLYCFCPVMADNQTLKSVLTPAQRELIRSHEGGAAEAMADRLAAIRRKLDSVIADNRIMQAELLFIMYDRLGCRRENFNRDFVEQLDLTDHGYFNEFVSVLENKLREYDRQKLIRDGRPIGF